MVGLTTTLLGYTIYEHFFKLKNSKTYEIQCERRKIIFSETRYYFYKKISY